MDLLHAGQFANFRAAKNTMAIRAVREEEEGGGSSKG